MPPDYELRSEDEKELMRLVEAWADAALVDDERTARAALLNHYRASRAGSAAEPAPEAAAPPEVPSVATHANAFVHPCTHGVQWYRCQVSCEECGHQCRQHYDGGVCTADVDEDSCGCDGFQSSPG